MLATADLQPPVGYDDRWLLVAGGAVVAVLTYYVLAWWLTRPRRPRAASEPGDREACLRELDRVGKAVRRGELTAREAHQMVSRVVRTFVQSRDGLSASTMTLTALHRDAPAPLTELVAALYPPQFAPDTERAARDIEAVLARARELVATWP